MTRIIYIKKSEYVFKYVVCILIDKKTVKIDKHIINNERTGILQLFVQTKYIANFFIITMEYLLTLLKRFFGILSFLRIAKLLVKKLNCV